MLNAPLPDLKSWTHHFSQQEIPVLSSTLARMHDLHGRIDDIGIRDVAHLVRHDPLLSLRLIRHLESHRHASQVTDVTTLDRILLMIGLGGFFRTFGHALTLESKLATQPQALEGCRRVCSRAHLAAKFAEMIGSRRHDLDPEEVATAALLHNTAEILLWTEAPSLSTEISSLLMNNPGMRSRDAQIQVLGITLHDLHMELLNTWHLPKLMQHLQDERYANEPRVRTVSVSTALARHLNNDWQDPALPDDYQIVADLIGVDPETAYKLVQRQALNVAREWEWFGVPPAAAKLVQCS
ncbi:HD-like signal output (HDOD) domain, no enzymatic activity [Formivibrio citricus]|uniref:HD-like signal output (HDOD) domain, no enzymatic activity n=1 Tax=Formivibrio citricus TaxID=83765 RepID=A0A1I4ZPM9_9NEIS|nr:HDOD domain-containing protein [Formivibrio citricus]SFN51939.1 HD-like signal output (HDOD) domain, no enzymatic activity [Formivibrio citricus]